jgi:predicted DNA-binding transcriptional regulator YafY
MAHPAIRLLSALELLQNHGRLSGGELAERLNVGRRTVRRYVAALEELGIPVTAEAGRGGGYMLVAGFKLPPMMFGDEEALALSLGLLAARSLGLADAEPAIESAQAKLERVLPAALKKRARAIAETVTLDLARPVAGPDGAVLAALSAAAQSRSRVHLRYRSPASGQSERDFDAYGIVYASGRWYAVGMCHLRGGVRSFRIDRIEAARAAAGVFERPAGFDALEHLKHSVAAIPRRFAAEILLETDLDTARRELRPALGLLEWTQRGVLLRSQVGSLAWLALELSRMPFEFEIRKPAALRNAVAANARRLSRLASAPGGPRRRAPSSRSARRTDSPPRAIE